MRDLASELQAAGEHALEEYLYANIGDIDDEDMFGGPCDCLTCIVREVLHGVWPIVESVMRKDASIRPSDPRTD